MIPLCRSRCAPLTTTAPSPFAVLVPVIIPAIVLAIGVTTPAGSAAVPTDASSLAVGSVAMPTRTDEPLAELFIVRGASSGPTLALVGGVHGGKVSAVRALERLIEQLDTTQLSGTLRIVPVAHRASYEAGLAQTSPIDGLNLNRVFPGNANGSATEQLAAWIIDNLVTPSDYLVDLHGSDGDEQVGRFAYVANPGILPSVDSAALKLAIGWGVPRVIWDREGPRTLTESRFLQTAAHLSNVPAMTVFEAGGAREEAAAVDAFERGIYRLMISLGMLPANYLQGLAEQARLQNMADGNSSRETLVHGSRSVIPAEFDGEWSPVVSAEQIVPARELLGHIRTATGVTAVHAATEGVVLHLRAQGPAERGMPLVILGVGRGSTLSLR